MYRFILQLNTLNTTEDSWASARSPSRASQQPIRAVSPRVRRNTENDEMVRDLHPILSHIIELCFVCVCFFFWLYRST